MRFPHGYVELHLHGLSTEHPDDCPEENRARPFIHSGASVRTGVHPLSEEPRMNRKTLNVLAVTVLAGGMFATSPARAEEAAKCTTTYILPDGSTATVEGEGSYCRVDFNAKT